METRTEEELNRPGPLEDWEKALYLVGFREKLVGKNAVKALARLTDWPLIRAEQAFAEAHLRSMVEPDDNAN